MLNPNGPGYSPNEVNNDGNGEGECGDQKIKSEGSLMRNRPLMAVIIVYCVFSLQEIAYSEVRELQFHFSKIMGVSSVEVYLIDSLPEDIISFRGHF